MFSSVVDGTYRKLFIIHSLTCERLALSHSTPSPYIFNRSQWVYGQLVDSFVENSSVSHTANAGGGAAKCMETDSCSISFQVLYWIYRVYSDSHKSNSLDSIISHTMHIEI